MFYVPQGPAPNAPRPQTTTSNPTHKRRIGGNPFWFVVSLWKWLRDRR